VTMDMPVCVEVGGWVVAWVIVAFFIDGHSQAVLCVTAVSTPPEHTNLECPVLARSDQPVLRVGLKESAPQHRAHMALQPAGGRARVARVRVLMWTQAQQHLSRTAWQSPFRHHLAWARSALSEHT
jgi:hypothetical protein